MSFHCLITRNITAIPAKIIEVISEEVNKEGKSVTLSRKFVVIPDTKDPYEQVYYLSSNTNSGAKQWLPCKMKKGLCMNGIMFSTDVDFASFSTILKIVRHMYRPNDKTLTQKHVQTSTGFDYSSRLPTKSHLIISARLSLSKTEDKCEGYSDELLKKLGLNDTEIKAAQEPLILEGAPQKIFYENNTCRDAIVVDEINQWLADQGAKIAEEVVKYQKENFLRD